MKVAIMHRRHSSELLARDSRSKQRLTGSVESLRTLKTARPSDQPGKHDGMSVWGSSRAWGSEKIPLVSFLPELESHFGRSALAHKVAVRECAVYSQGR